MWHFSKYDIIGFLTSSILYFCFVFFILKLATAPFFKLEKQANFDNVVFIEFSNFISENVENSANLESTQIFDDLQSEFENLEKEIELENLQNEFENLELKLPKKDEIKEKPKTAKPNKQNSLNLKKSINKNGENLANLAFDDINLNSQNSNLQNQNSKANSDISALITKIISNYAKKNYPQTAKKFFQTGVVGVSFYYTTDKKVQNLQIFQSSGYDSLDEAALDAVKKTKSKFPKPTSSDHFKFYINFSLTN